jgi:hypothetical protein
MIETIDVDDNIALRMEDGRAIEFNASEHRNFDHGYAVTSHSSQGITAARVEEVGSHLNIPSGEQQKFYDEHKNEMAQPEAIRLHPDIEIQRRPKAAGRHKKDAARRSTLA